jgi:hypothetical protein
MRVSRATGAEVERLRNIRTGGTLEFNQDSDYETGTIDYTGELSLGADLLRVYLDAAFQDGTSESIALGTFIVSAPKRDKVGTVATGSARLSGRLREVAEDEFDGPITVPAGTNAVSYAVGLLRSAGLEVVADPSDFKLSSTWALGLDDSGGGMSKRLGAVNRLLDLAGFSPARCDGMGRVILSRYVEPADRPVALTLEEGASARFENSAVDERDIADCDQLLQDMQCLIAMDVTSNINVFERVTLMIDREIELLKGYRKSVKLTGAQTPEQRLSALEEEIERLRSV